MFLFGIVLAILGTIFGLRPQVDFAQRGNIFLALYLGVFIATILVGPIIDRFGNKVVLVTSGILVTAALIAFAGATSYGALAAGFLLGFGGGGLNTAANALVADLYPDERGARLNVVGMFFGLGALVVPLGAAIVSGLVSVPQLLLGTSALAAACTVVYLSLRFPPPSEAGGFSPLASVKAARIPGVLLLGMLLFFQSGNESSVGGWTSTYAGSTGLPPRTATMILAGYWAALMSGRLAAARLLQVMSKPRLVLASAIGSAIGCATLLASTATPLLFIGAMVTGFSHAAIYPTTLAIAADRHQRLAGTIFGFLFATGLIGGMLFPFGIGHLSQSFGIRTAMVLPLCGAAVIAILATRVAQSFQS
jgi:fucose permease